MLLEHVERLFDGRQSFGERGLVGEPIKADVAAFFFCVARETVLGEEGLNRSLIFTPVGGRARVGNLAGDPRGET
jgi:hypothetical protein